MIDECDTRKKNMNLLVLNRNVMILSAIVYMSGIIVVHDTMIYFWKKLLVPSRRDVQNVIAQ